MDVKVDIDKTKRNKSVGIIGTGNYARALAKRLTFSGYAVTLGSRRPESRELSVVDECLCDVQIRGIVETIEENDVIFVAIHVENFKDTLAEHADSFSGKLVIDVTNRDNQRATISNAEYLSTIIPKANVTKAFNVISAYAMENDIAGGSRQVYVAGNDISARDQVCIIARDMGFVACDLGNVRSSRKIEAFVLNLFPGWKIPIFITFVIFNLWSLYIAYIYFVAKTAYRWDQIFLKVFNKPLCMTAITVLALTYLPSNIAAILQIFYGTKHRRFPRFLDTWLKTRKQYGIISFTLVFAHVIMSTLMMSPTYYSSWFQKTAVTIPANMTDDLVLPMKSWMIWKGELACLVGIIAFIILCFIVISTLPSVGDLLNWREWRLIQSKLGYISLFLSVVHACIMGAPGWIRVGFIRMLGSITFLSIILPCCVLLLKVILSIPCVNCYVMRIRRGWERNVPADVAISRNSKSRTCNYRNMSMRAPCCACSRERPVTTALLPTSNCDCTTVV